MFKKISIDELTPGMYVEAIAEKSAQCRVAQKGYVKTRASIEKLKKSGVISVIIDTGKFLAAKPNQEDEVVPHRREQGKAKSFEQRVAQARLLYKKAKELQHKALESLSEGRAIDLEPFVELADKFIDSLFEDQDALMLAAMIRNKDEYLLEHSINVSILLATFARYLNWHENDIRNIALGGFLHDIGKIKVDDAILMKPGKLTPEEFEEMKRHVEYGIEALADMPDLPPIARDVVAMHHEKINGRGYPAGLTADEISLAGKMAAICDCYDAITATRVYKEGEVSGRAFKILLADSGSHFDSELVGQFIKCLGVYPVGTLVILSSGKLGVVLRVNKEYPLRPLVKVFYNWRHKHFIEPKEIDMRRAHVTEEIERSVRPESLDIDVGRFIEEFVI
jgi:putative nucleotidyltransferase with HDIG domain